MKTNHDMNITISKTDSVIRTVVVDVVLLATICIIPALSHIVAFPLYKLNPMLLCLLAGMLFVGDRRNAYLLAVMLPLVSMLVSGMPFPLKTLCMIPELLTVVALFQLLQNRWKTFPAIITAIIGGKVVYYALKAMIIAPAMLVGTSLLVQGTVALLFAVAFAILYSRRQ